MDRTGSMLRGKENVEQQENGRMSEHATKVREAREARRKRILARSSERLAFITGEANAIPTSPLLDQHKSNALISLSSLLNQDSTHQSSDKEPTIKKSFLFNEHELTQSLKKPVNNRENTSQEGVAAPVAQPLENEEATEASKERAHEQSTKENSVTLKSVFNNCIKQSLFPRLMSATCIALTFLASGFTQGSRHVGVSSPATSASAQSGHLGGLDGLTMICFCLASVMLVDILLYIGTFFFFQGGEHLKMMRKREAIAADKATLSILLHFLFSVSLDCTISATLLCGGFALLPKGASPSNV